MMATCLLQVALESGSGPDEASLGFLFGGLGLCTIGVGLGFLAWQPFRRHWPQYEPSGSVPIVYLVGVVVAHGLGSMVGRAWLLSPGGGTLDAAGLAWDLRAVGAGHRGSGLGVGPGQSWDLGPRTARLVGGLGHGLRPLAPVPAALLWSGHGLAVDPAPLA